MRDIPAMTNRILSMFNITSSDTFFHKMFLLKRPNEKLPFASIEITDDGKEILRVGNVENKGHLIIVEE